MTSTRTVSKRRFDAVQQLQELRDRFSPGSFKQRAAEHAIDLALSPDRSVSEYLAEDALRNAKHILSRRKQRSGLMPLSTEEAVLPSHFPTPRDDARHESFFSQLISRAEETHEHGRSVLAAMVRKEPVRRTAERINVSKSTVIRIRASIREAAKELRARPGGGPHE